MKKVIWGFIIAASIILWGTFIVWVFSDNKATASSIVENCQYPVRPLKDGQCDNEDPCDPERIKEDGGFCRDSEPEKIEVIEPKETLTYQGGK